MGYRVALATALVLASSAGWAGAPKVAVEKAQDTAALFGAREGMTAPALSPDGTKVLYLSSDATTGTAVMIASAAGGSPPTVATGSQDPNSRVIDCDWVDDRRIACRVYGVGPEITAVKWFAVDADGKNFQRLAEPTGDSLQVLRISQYDSGVIDWIGGGTGKVLIARDHVPQRDIGTNISHSANGLGVDLVDTRTMASAKVEEADPAATSFISDGKGVVRFKSVGDSTSSGYVLDTEHWYYRLKGSRDWKLFSTVTEKGPGLRPLVVDPAADVAYCLDRRSGRDALYRVALDGSMRAELVYADPKFDVDDVVRLGRQARLIGATTSADDGRVVYFDPEYKALAAALSRALPDLPMVDFVSASADEQKLLIFAGSDTDPGRYYVFDRATKRLNEIALVRPELEHARLATMKLVSYRAADGTAVPAYLSLPPGSPGKNIPAIVMPHGGPASHDRWGFDWLVQFFAARGYAVLQPEYRGSTGYGDDWQVNNGFQNWRTAIGDVVDAGKWLVSSGVADPSKLAIVGWSYGGYAALQSQVVDPGLFKAAVAIAPVTDLDLLKQEAGRYTSAVVVRDYIGGGPNAVDGSPDRHVDRFKAPVLMFHGTRDRNVDVNETRVMNQRLRAAGKQSDAVIYDGLDHQLPSSEIRADMLRRADAFLRQSMAITG